MSRTVEVPDGCKAVFFTEQFAETFAEWKRIDGVEARVISTDDPVVVDVETRFTVEDRE